MGKNIFFNLAGAGLLTPNQSQQLSGIINRLEKNEPLQYIFQTAYFLDIELKVNSSVLIPRPETEELVLWVLETELQNQKTLLDLCTGSGCIAVALCKKGNWKKIAGLDVSELALEIAAENAKLHGCNIDWLKLDLLIPNIEMDDSWDVMVSNPPYVLHSESAKMDQNVLKYEPGIALFVSNDDLLVVYAIIANLAVKKLNRDGVLYFEINPLFTLEVKNLLQQRGFERVDIKKDIFGKERMIRAFKP